jgi:hypothetical protein
MMAALPATMRKAGTARKLIANPVARMIRMVLKVIDVLGLWARINAVLFRIVQ